MKHELEYIKDKLNRLKWKCIMNDGACNLGIVLLLSLLAYTFYSSGN